MKIFTVRNITASDINQFRKDFEKLSVEQYMKFVMPLSKKDFGVLANFMICDVVYNFDSFLKTVNKFYRIYGKKMKVKELMMNKDKEILIEINGKKVPLSELPCIKNNCEWRYSIHCPKCEWNKNGKVKVY